MGSLQSGNVLFSSGPADRAEYSRISLVRARMTNPIAVSPSERGGSFRSVNGLAQTFSSGEVAMCALPPRQHDEKAEARAHKAVNAAKVALGERGPVWWDDGAPDFNRHMARNTPYSEWFAALE